MKEKGSNHWQEFEDAVESFTKVKSKMDENLKKQGLHNIGCCKLCGKIHYTNDPILKNVGSVLRND
jgi:hypothetical protein